MKNKKAFVRDSSIDIAKGIGIFLVVIGHCINSKTYPGIFIYAFHMPLFFLIAGLCFNYENHNDFLPFLNSRIKTLILPACIFTIIDIVISHITAIPTIPWNTFLWNGFTNAKWFLGTLFVVEILYYCILRIFKDKKKIQIFFISLGFLVAYSVSTKQIDYPYCLYSIYAATSYYGIGYIFRNKVIGKENASVGKWRIPLSISLLILFCVVTCLVGKGMDLAHNKFSLFNIIPSLLGTVMIIYYSKSIIWGGSVSNLLIWLGKNSLVIMCVHILFINISEAYLKPFLDSYMDYKITEQFFVWCSSMISVLLVNKYARSLIGK